MSTKAQIESKIALITTGGLNTAQEALDIWNLLKDELFTVEDIDSYSINSFSSKPIPLSGQPIDYNFTIKKSGNQGIIKIRIKNTTASAISASTTTPKTIFTWKNTPYEPKSGSLINDIVIQVWAGTNISLVLLNSSGLYLISSLPVALPNIPYYESSFETYITKD